MGKLVDDPLRHETELLRKMKGIFAKVEESMARHSGADDKPFTFEEFVASVSEEDGSTRRHFVQLAKERRRRRRRPYHVGTRDALAMSAADQSLVALLRMGFFEDRLAPRLLAMEDSLDNLEQNRSADRVLRAPTLRRAMRGTIDGAGLPSSSVVRAAAASNEASSSGAAASRDTAAAAAAAADTSPSSDSDMPDLIYMS